VHGRSEDDLTGDSIGARLQPIEVEVAFLLEGPERMAAAEPASKLTAAVEVRRSHVVQREPVHEDEDLRDRVARNRLAQDDRHGAGGLREVD
jgi:hypothetical protein